MNGYSVKDSIAHAISLTLDAECRAADKDEILDALDTAYNLIETQGEEFDPKKVEVWEVCRGRDNALNHLDSAEFSIEVLEKRNSELLKKIETQAAEIESLEKENEMLSKSAGDYLEGLEEGFAAHNLNEEQDEGIECPYCGKDYV